MTSIKWQAYEMPMQIYKNHPEFCRFLESSPLLNQIKVTRDRPFELEGQAAILVEGKPMKWPELKHRFETAYSKKFDEKFIIDRSSRHVYTYLDDGNGLQKHHPFLSERKVIGKINAEELKELSKCARQFVRAGEAGLTLEERRQLNVDRVHVLQIVSSWKHKGDSNLHRLLFNPDHPYIRLVAGKEHQPLNMQAGDVYEVGYRSKRKITFPFPHAKGVGNPQFLPFLSTQGLFRSPDFSEYVPTDARYVTNICLTDQEAENFYAFIERYHRESIHLGNLIGFHLGSQNCTTFINKVLHEVGIPVPTELSAAQIIRKISPDWFKTLGQGVNRARKALRAWLSHVAVILPSTVQNGIRSVASAIVKITKKIFQAMLALPWASCIFFSEMQ